MGDVGETERAGGGSRSSTVACETVSYCSTQRKGLALYTPRYLFAHNDCIASFS
jgi:hypothetical protein